MKASSEPTGVSHPVAKSPATGKDIWRATRIAFVCCLCIAAAYVVITTADTTFRTTSPVVFWDAWQWIELLKSWLESGFTWSSLFAVQNEHQIAVERILLLADYYVSSGANWPLVLLNIVLFASVLLTLPKLFMSTAIDGHVDRIDLVAYSAFVAVVLFAAANLANLNWSFVVSYVFAMTSIVFAALTAILTSSAAQRGEVHKTWGWLAVTISIAVIASLSGANGILIWPVVFIILVFGGLRKRHLVAFASIGAVMVVMYVLDLKLNTAMNADPRVTWRNPATYFDYLPYFLGNAIVDGQKLTRRSFVLGWIGLMGSIVAGLVFIRTRKSWNAYQLGFLGILTFELLTGAMIALARQNWGGGYAMVVDRYRLPNAIFWSAAIGLLLSISWPRAGMKEAARVVTAGMMAWLTIGIVTYQNRTLERYIERYLQWEVAADALRTQIMDKLVLSAITLPDHPTIVARFNFLRQHRLSVFADGRFEQVGKPLSVLYQMSDVTCEGGVRNISAVGGESNAWRSAGQAWDPLEKRVPGPFIFVDDTSKMIIGLASRVPSRPIYIRSSKPSQPNGWEGYFRAPAKSTVSLYGLRRDMATVCHVATLHVE